MNICFTFMKTENLKAEIKSRGSIHVSAESRWNHRCSGSAAYNRIYNACKINNCRQAHACMAGFSLFCAHDRVRIYVSHMHAADFQQAMWCAHIGTDIYRLNWKVSPVTYPIVYLYISVLRSGSSDHSDPSSRLLTFLVLKVKLSKKLRKTIHL